MVAPLDPVVAQIIPQLPLRDPQTMTPQSAREALRTLVRMRASRRVLRMRRVISSRAP
jgi:acetyl esterase